MYVSVEILFLILYGCTTRLACHGCCLDVVQVQDATSLAELC